LAIAAAPFSLGSVEGFGHSKYVKFHTSPTAESIQWRVPAALRVIGLLFNLAGGISFAITKNGMTAGTLAEGTQIDDGIMVDSSSFQQGFYLLRWSVNEGDIVTFSKNQASAPDFIIYYEYV